MTSTYTDKAETNEAVSQQKNNTSVNSQFSDNRSSAIAQRKLQEWMQNKPESVAQRTMQSCVPNSAPIQKIAVTDSDITGTKQVERWVECEPAINALIKSSPFGDAEARHEVIVKAVPGGNGMLAQKFGTTSIYQYDEDGGKWMSISSTPSFSDAAVKCYCVYIELLMGANNTTEKLFTTFLHEWNAHAIPAMALIKNKEKMEKDDVEWETFEHLKYSQMSDEDLKISVDSLLKDKPEGTRESVFLSIKKDRDNYKSK